MAIMKFFCLALSIILFGSITSATVDIALDQDGPVCGGMRANFKCTTTTANGRLRWIVNNDPVFIVGSGVSNSFNNTVNGSLFVFSSGIPVSTTNVYSSFALLNTLDATTIQCSDEFVLRSRTVVPEVTVRPGNVSRGVIGNNFTVTWNASTDSICCGRYRVGTSRGETINTMATTYTLMNITTNEERENASVSVRCLDQLGTEGPEVVSRLTDIVRQPVEVSMPEPIGDFCSNNVVYRVNLTIPNLSSGLVAEVEACYIENKPVDCGSHASMTVNGLTPFNVSLTFTYGLGFEPIVRYVTLNASQIQPFQTFCRENALIGGCIALGVFSLIAVIIAIVLLVEIVRLRMMKPKPKQTSPQDLQQTSPQDLQEQDIVKSDKV